VHFVGRLATYKYYNMDQVVAQALTLYKRLTEKEEAAKPVRPAIAGSTALVEKLINREPAKK
jgi:UDP-galactopyranose mutase